MPNAPVPAAATGLPCAQPKNGLSPTRRLFLAAGPAAAVFGSLAAAARPELSTPLVLACRKALAANEAYEHLAEEDDEGFEALSVIENEGVEIAIHTLAASPSELRAKAELLRAQLPRNKDGTDIWDAACEADRLTWSLIQDVLTACAEG